MTIRTKQFIENHIDLIDEENWEEIYSDAYEFGVGELTEILMQIGLNPLLKLTKVPKEYLLYSSVQSIEIPNNITSIGTEAFFRCENLTDIKLNEGLEIIHAAAFAECSKLSSIVLPNSLEYIESEAFAETPLKQITIPDKVTTLDDRCFEACKLLEDVVLSKNLARISTLCFGECISLKNIPLPEGLKLIDEFAFKECFSLKELYIPSTVTYIDINAFYKVSDSITLLCNKDSYAEKYAIRNHIRYKVL